MDDNFHDAIYRMFDASVLLYQNKQWFSANYLAGYVIECYSKLLLNISLDQGYIFSGITSGNVRSFGHNISNLQDELDLLSLSGCMISSYCVNLSETCPTLLSNWNPNRRYGSNSDVLNTKPLADHIHDEINTLIETVLKMEIDGVIV